MLLPQDRKFSMNLADFTKICRSAGVFMNLQHASSANQTRDTFVEDNFPPPHAGSDVRSVLGKMAKNLQPFTRYCTALVDGIAQTTRFAVVAASDLCTVARSFYDTIYNPYTRPAHTNGEFGTFLVDAVNPEAVRIRTNNIAKYDEYCTYYQVASYLYDCTQHLASLMHCSKLDPVLVRPVALITQCISEQVHQLDYKLTQVHYFTHSDVTMRELAKATIKPQHDFMTHHDEFASLHKHCADIKLRRARDDLSKAKGTTSN